MMIKLFNTPLLQDGYDPKLRRHSYYTTSGSGAGLSYAAGTGQGDGNGSGAAAAGGDTIECSQSIGSGDGRGRMFGRIKQYEVKDEHQSEI